jgi:hypothetical protein
MTNTVTLQKFAVEVVRLAEERLGRRTGFAVLAFEFGSGGNIGYASNAKREDMLEALEEFIIRESTKGRKVRLCSSCGKNLAAYVLMRCDLCSECHDALQRTGMKIKARSYGGGKKSGPVVKRNGNMRDCCGKESWRACRNSVR